MAGKILRKEKDTKRRARSTRAVLLAGQLAALVLRPGTIRRSLKVSHLTNRRRRLLLAASSLAAISMVGSLGAAVTFGFFSSTAAQTSKFAAGTVTLAESASSACSVTGILPGATGGPCTLQVTYSGSVAAYLGLDVFIATKAQVPGTIPLYDPSDSSNDLQISVSDGQSPQVTYLAPTSVPTVVGCTTVPGSGFDSTYICYELSDVLVSTTPFTNDGTDTFTTTVSVPTSSTTGYQGGTASIVLLAHAVQSAHQNPGSCTAGSPCTSIVWS